MRVPFSLLKKYLDVDLPLTKIADLLTLSGLEVDAIENREPPFSHVVAAKVQEVQKHPNADNLVVAQVHDGNEIVQVVCGAPNCKKGLITAFAKVGAHITDEGKVFTIKKAKLRGEDSFGMLLSEKELSISDNHEKIIELPPSFEIGSDLSILADPVFCLSLTPNLGHCMSIIGVARELGAIINKKVSLPKAPITESTISIEKKISAQVANTTAVPRYALRLIEGIKMVPTPFWIKKALISYGMRSINVVVDILNFSMIETGQPFHAFDYDRLEDKNIEVIISEKNLNMMALDNEDKKVPPSSIIISNSKQPIAIAGVIGDLKTSVTEETKNILIEAAIFDPITIRKTTKALNIRSESSIRFEKGCDKGNVLQALQRTCSLIQQICGGEIAKGAIDIKKGELATKKISLRTEKVNSLLGTNLSINEIQSLLERLNFTTKIHKENQLLVTVPTYRNDIAIEVDLIEEVGRIYGYNSIEKKPPYFTLPAMKHSPIYLMEKKLKTTLMMEGMQELITPDLISPQWIQKLGESPSTYPAVQHAKSQEHAFLRTSYLPSFLEVLRHNIDHHNKEVLGFEISRLHFKEDDNIVEKPALGLIFFGHETPYHWQRKSSPIDFFYVKGIIENLFERFAEKVHFSLANSNQLHPSRQATITLDKQVIGVVGQVHPSIIHNFDIKHRNIFFAEIDTTSLIAHKEKKYIPQSAFPSSTRDWTVAVKKDFSYGILKDLIEHIKSPLLEGFYLLDIYYDPEKDENLHNLTIRFTYRDPRKTISYEDVEREHQKILQKVTKKLFQ